MANKHSRFGIASTILALCIWLYLAISLLLFFETNLFTSFYDKFLSSNQGGMIKGMGDFGLFILLMLFLFLVVPILGHLCGIVLGLIGSFSKTKIRVFGVIGLFLNILPFVLLGILYLVGSS
ncbi:MAG: hypothetical protein K1X72_03375 [Pyrinomonadaceae bacterium]|nr:hypothetical protein [Pyrinomonadaceae bacterium]